VSSVVSRVESSMDMESGGWADNGIFIPRYAPAILLESTGMTCMFGHCYHRTPAVGHLWRPAFLVRHGSSLAAHHYAAS